MYLLHFQLFFVFVLVFFHFVNKVNVIENCTFFLNVLMNIIFLASIAIYTLSACKNSPEGQQQRKEALCKMIPASMKLFLQLHMEDSFAPCHYQTSLWLLQCKPQVSFSVTSPRPSKGPGHLQCGNKSHYDGGELLK